jgi:hypothetical protein
MNVDRLLVRGGIAALGVVLVVNTAAAQCPSNGRRVAIGTLSTVYIGNALYGAHLALRDSLEEAPFGWRQNRTVSDDFYTGFGTALSPGLPMLIAQAGVSTMLVGSSRTAQRGANVLAVFGALYTIGQLAEPITYRTLRRPSEAPDRLHAIIGNVIVPAALTAVAARSCR